MEGMTMPAPAATARRRPAAGFADPFDTASMVLAAGADPGLARDGAKIGAALFGNSDAAYEKGYKEAATLENTMLDARKKRDAELGRAGRKESMRRAGVQEDQIDLLDNLLNAGDNPEQVSGYQLDRQKLGFGNDAMTVARNPAGDLGELNRMLMVLDGKPSDLTDVKDHTLINPMVTPDKQDVDLTTLQGQLNAALTDSQIQRNTKTGDAALIRANKPPAARGGKTDPEREVLAQARERIAAGHDPKAVADYLSRKGYPGAAGKIYKRAKPAAADKKAY